MKLIDMISKYEGDVLKDIIEVTITPENEKVVEEITGKQCGGLKELTIMLFEKNKGLAFTSFDCDGYRDDDWYLIELKRLLDKGNTKTIKKLNELVKKITYTHDSSGNCLLIELTDHIVKMGQNATDSYYPSNFFSIEDCRKFALGEIVEMEP